MKDIRDFLKERITLDKDSFLKYGTKEENNLYFFSSVDESYKKQVYYSVLKREVEHNIHVWNEKYKELVLCVVETGCLTVDQKKEIIFCSDMPSVLSAYAERIIESNEEI